MTAMLPAGTFTTPVQYSLHQVTGSDLDPQAGLLGATVDPVAAYQLSFDAVSLNEPASVTFEIMLDHCRKPIACLFSRHSTTTS
jgi:hypothetical protein